MADEGIRKVDDEFWILCGPDWRKRHGQCVIICTARDRPVWHRIDAERIGDRGTNGIGGEKMAEAKKPAEPKLTAEAKKEIKEKEIVYRVTGQDYRPVYEKLGKIQAELFVPKDKKNDFGGYNYRSCEDILMAVKPLCDKYKCVIRLRNEVEQIGERIYNVAMVEFYDLESGECLCNKAQAREADTKKGMDDAQVTGAAMSYARKYALAGLFCIDNEKDPDATNTHGQKEPPAKEEKRDTVNATQIKAIRAELDRTGVSESVILDAIKKKKLEEATQADYVTLMRRLNKTTDK